jgi:hypothetical protein
VMLLLPVLLAVRLRDDVPPPPGRQQPRRPSFFRCGEDFFFDVMGKDGGRVTTSTV